METLFDEPSRRALPSEPELADVRLAVIKGGLGAIPVIGSALGEALGLLLVPPLTERRDQWFGDLARRLRDLEKKVEGFRFENLANNDQFVSATVQATQSALRTHQADKLNALRNAVLNTALGRGGEDNRHAALIGLIDRLTPAHLHILNRLDIPQNYHQWELQATLQQPRGPVEWVKNFIPGMASEDAGFIKMLINELQAAGLIAMKGDDPYIPQAWRWVTSFGDDFLRLISKPSEEGTK